MEYSGTRSSNTKLIRESYRIYTSERTEENRAVWERVVKRSGLGIAIDKISQEVKDKWRDLSRISELENSSEPLVQEVRALVLSLSGFPERFYLSEEFYQRECIKYDEVLQYPEELRPFILSQEKVPISFKNIDQARAIPAKEKALIAFISLLAVGKDEYGYLDNFTRLEKLYIHHYFPLDEQSLPSGEEDWAKKIHTIRIQDYQEPTGKLVSRFQASHLEFKKSYRSIYIGELVGIVRWSKIPLSITFLDDNDNIGGSVRFLDSKKIFQIKGFQYMYLRDFVPGDMEYLRMCSSDLRVLSIWECEEGTMSEVLANGGIEVFRSLNNLKMLRLNGVHLSGKELSEILRVIPNLEEFEHDEMGNKKKEALEPLKERNIKQLSLSACQQMDDDDLDFIASLETLEDLHIRGVGDSKGSIMKLGRLKNLSKLELSGSMWETTLEEILELLRELPNLEFFSLEKGGAFYLTHDINKAFPKLSVNILDIIIELNDTE
jgi:hypothetical protein